MVAKQPQVIKRPAGVIVKEKSCRDGTIPSLDKCEDDTVLRKVAKIMLQKMPASKLKQLRASSDKLAPKLSIFSLCSGSEIHQRCGEALFSVLKTKTAYTTAAACECKDWKQTWIESVMHKDSNSPCIFKEISDMQTGVGPCAVHSPETPMCQVPLGEKGQKAVVAGFSCKDLSTMNSKTRGNSDELKDGTGSSARTFAALIAFLVIAGAAMWLGENVDDLHKMTSQNRQYMMDQLAAIGWVAVTVSLNAAHYGARTARVRTYIIAINCWGCNITHTAARELLKKMVETIEELRIDQLPLSDFLLPEKSPYLLKVLKNLTEGASSSSSSSSSTSASSSGSSSSAASTSVPAESQNVWKNNFDKLLKKRDMTWSQCKLPNKVLSSAWHHALTNREKMILSFELATDENAFSLDLGQNPGWGSKGRDGTIQVILPRNRIWLVPFSRLLCGLEGLLFHGFDVNELIDLDWDDARYMDLAGNSFQGFAYLAVLIGALTHWPSYHDIASHDMEDEAAKNEDAVDELFGF